MTPDEAFTEAGEPFATSKMVRDWLRKPFKPEQIGKLPATAKRPALDFVGHAAVTDRLNQIAPDWHYTVDELFSVKETVWIRGTMTIGGISRPEYGDGGDPKEAIGNFIRRGAMRFGVAIDLWSKEDLGERDAPRGAGAVGKGKGSPGASDTSAGHGEPGRAAAPVESPAPADPTSPAATSATKGGTRAASGVAQAALEHRPTGSEVPGSVPAPVAVAGPPAGDSPAGGWPAASSEQWGHAKALGITGAKAVKLANDHGWAVKRQTDVLEYQLDVLIAEARKPSDP